MPEASLSLSGDASSVPTARHFVVQTLTAWECGAAAWAAAQIVSELASNCSLHAHTEYTVRLRKDDEQLRLEVHDSSAARVRPRRYTSESTTGRGLMLVESLAQSWGVEIDRDGKTVWVALHVTGDDGGAGQVDEEADIDVDSLLDAFGDDEDDEDRTTAWTGLGPALRAAA